jgi:hypothetical protein
LKLSHIYIAILLIILFTGCKEEVNYRINFYHYLHVEENEQECTDCHGELTAGMFAPADHDICIDCHDEVDADDISSDTCGMCHIEKDLETIGEWFQENPTRGVFRHSEALSGSCRECHVDTVKEGSTKVVFWKRSDVVAIRNRAHLLGFECQTCHESMNKETPWKTHETNWIKRHGMFANDEMELCNVCHIQENCSECHQQQAPSSHVNLWRWQTHGIEASWSRENCQVCHKDDFCVACHTSSEPRSHVAGWLSNDLHCVNCHISVSECSICHTRGVFDIHNAAAPVITQPFHDPANLVNPTACLAAGCHDPGGAEPAPASHLIFTESDCLSCHQ